MRVDVHTHIFTLRAILNREAIRVIGQRLRDKNVPGWLVDAVEELLDDQLDRPEYLDQRRLLKLLIEKLTGVASFNRWLSDTLSGDTLEVRIRGDLDGLPADVLSDLLTRMAQRHSGEGIPGMIVNVVETLRIAMQPTITDVADSILDGMDPDDVVVALMMDIYHSPESARDRRTYQHHILGTAEAALQRPGRILPFFGVHPDRPSHFDNLRQAVEQRGFVGVKLYPSLGFSVDSPTMRRVYDYCVEKELPVLLHCGHGGFYRDEEKKQLCDPAQWNAVLAHPDYKGKLRVCFAHFGGWEALAHRHALDENWPPNQPEEDNWGRKIRDFMITHPNVYADLAKHVGMFERPADTTTYFQTIQELMDDPDVGERILFGTDAWLLRLDMPFDRYRQRWRDAAGHTAPDLFERITGHGSRRFVGLDDGSGGLALNIRHFVDYMAREQNRLRVGAQPAAWLRDAVGKTFRVDRDSPMWDRRKLAARIAYAFLKKQLSARDKEADWRTVGNVRLQRLEYFDRDAPDFAARCRTLARQLVKIMERRPENPAPGNDPATAFHRFSSVFSDGAYRLCDVAASLELGWEFPEVAP